MHASGVQEGKSHSTAAVAAAAASTLAGKESAAALPPAASAPQPSHSPSLVKKRGCARKDASQSSAAATAPSKPSSKRGKPGVSQTLDTSQTQHTGEALTRRESAAALLASARGVAKSCASAHQPHPAAAETLQHIGGSQQKHRTAAANTQRASRPSQPALSVRKSTGKAIGAAELMREFQFEMGRLQGGHDSSAVVADARQVLAAQADTPLPAKASNSSVSQEHAQGSSLSAGKQSPSAMSG